MKTYHVQWEIEVTAKNPIDAAVIAFQVQRAEGSIAKVFAVTNSKGRTARVDLDDDELGLNLCDVCGANAGSNGLSCPDGAYVCRDCFDAGHH